MRTDRGLLLDRHDAHDWGEELRFIATLADCMLSVILPRKSARAQTCWTVSCGCINHQKYTKICCPGVCTSCEPTGVKC